MTEEDKLDILEQKIKNKIAFQQEHSTHAKFYPVLTIIGIFLL